VPKLHRLDDVILAAPPGRVDSGLWALARVARNHQVRLSPEELGQDLGLGDRYAGFREIIRAAKANGLRAKPISRLAIAGFKALPRPLIIELVDGRFAVLRSSRDGRPALQLARASISEPMEWPRLAEICSGRAILVARRWDDPATSDQFGFRWFFDVAWRYKKPLSHVLISSFVLQLFALTNPLFFQLIIDKVLVHQSLSTLTLITLVMIAVAVFDAILQYLRTYALAHTSNRIDVELGAALFKRLMALPLRYFETRAAGQTVARVRELETIRSFFTGAGLTSAVDAIFASLFLAVMFLYSWRLALIASGAIILLSGACLFIRPLLQQLVAEKFNRGAASQQLLVEAIVGAPTLKSAAAESVIGEQWEERLAAYIRSSFSAQMLVAFGQSMIGFVIKASTIAIICVGAQEVIAGRLSVGGLVAFNMLNAQITSPIMRLANLWQDFQQVQLSVSRLGDILNTPPEAGRNAVLSTGRITGAIGFSGVTFRYDADNSAATLENVSLEIAPGEVIGIVGASGSGKSTIAKLIQRLYLPNEGRITIDGHDLCDVNPVWLRRQIGVVLQENLLFNRSIHDNIALSAPGLSRSDVVYYATLAGADEFIRKLPNGYDMMIEERGANLSGGQRQRIAIARALIRDPKILIFDEATSALDYESERIVHQNMQQICDGRTVIIIAHRLASVRRCHRIYAVENGRIVENGSHEDLVSARSGIYAALWRLQGETA